jgi:glycerophosphoryl diester phosphodiesterase
MSVLSLLEKPFHLIVDAVFAKRTQPLPSREQLENCKLISHRGEHDNATVLENTLPAFDQTVRSGIWGIEFDIRWTKDLHPVVFHDRDCKRIFQSTRAINTVTLAELQDRFPLIPSLAEVIQRYGQKLHLMAEIKAEVYPDPAYQNQLLGDLFAPLEPRTDFHLISMSPEMFDIVDFVPGSTFLPVARLNYRELSAMSLQKSYGGFNAHYLFVTDTLLRKHHDCGQKVGTGFIASKNCLFRELNREVDWIFSNNAGELQAVVDNLLIKA